MVCWARSASNYWLLHQQNCKRPWGGISIRFKRFEVLCFFKQKIEMRNLAIPYRKEIKSNKKQQALAKKFFPSYVLKITALINLIYRIQPKTAFWMTAKLLSVTGRKKISVNAKALYKKGEKRQYKVKNNVFYTYSYGKGPAVLMLHGWYSNAARWRLYVNELVRSGYKVVLVDAPGHGNAPGRFLSVFLYAKGIKKILKSEPKWHAVITHSLAGLTAIAAIGNSEKKYHPSKFIMMNTFADGETMLKKFSHCLGISEKVISGTKQWMSGYPEFALQEFSICKQYNNINTEGLLIYDTKDSVVPKREAESIINTTKTLQTIRTEGLGHNLKSDDIVTAVINFVKNGNSNVIPLNPIDNEVVVYA